MTGAHADAGTGHKDGAHPEPHPPEHVAPRPGHSRNRSLAWQLGTPVVVLLCGSLLAVSATNSEGTDLRPGRYQDLASLVEGEAADYRDLEQGYQALSAEVDRLSGSVQGEGIQSVRRQVRQLRDPAGLTARSGPGLTITLADSPNETLLALRERNKALPPEQRINLNRFVVHQQDIQEVVNALWLGGATAVTIAGQRVISTTGIKCQGNAVQLQGVPYPQPYVIQAVGDPTALTAAVDTDTLVSGFRADAANPEIAVNWTLDAADRVDAPAYKGLLDLRYAKPLRPKR